MIEGQLLFPGYPESLLPKPEPRPKRPQDFDGSKPGPGRGHKRDRDQEVLERWNAPGPAGFWNWVSDVRPHVIGRDSRYHVWEPTEKQVEAVNNILAVDGNGRFKHSLSMLIEPRRHGKSTVFALLVLWLTTSRQNHVTQLLGNTFDHARRVQFKTLNKIIGNTPTLSKMIPPDWRTTKEINFPPLGSTIQLGEGLSAATSFGDRLNVLWVSDFHACPDTSAYNALESSLLDSEDSLILIDSNVDEIDGHVHSLQREADQDETIFCRHVCYRDINEFSEHAPQWIDRTKAKRKERTSLPADFKRDILGQRSESKNALFPAAMIELCKAEYLAPPDDISALIQGRAYKIGGGLDRAKSFSPLGGGDNTVWTVVLKVASPRHGEPEFYILSQTVFRFNVSQTIKKQILKDHERFHLDNVVLENYETADLYSWMLDQKIPVELLSAHDTIQNISFPEFHRIVRDGRLHIPAARKGTRLHFQKEFRGLTEEMSTFVYTHRAGANKYSFGHSSQKFKDDRVYSLNWAIHSLRSAVLHSYELGSFQCRNKSSRRNLCYMFGGSLQLLCSEQCQAHKQVEHMFMEYLQHETESELTLPDFFETKVRFGGARIYQAA